ncbi:MAG: hypothetical protein V2I33_00795 [Kangiellaceae bacterium]|jgi:hypothetical protein|nr:hypothetical protein [Kangiellaceae bacterium]
MSNVNPKLSISTSDMLKLKPGLSSDDILEMFGEPMNIRVSGCGMGAGRWQCTIWEYGDYGCRGQFYFSTERDGLRLNSFDIERDDC